MVICKIVSLKGVTEDSVREADAIVSVLDPNQSIPVEVELGRARKLILRFSDFEYGERNGPGRNHIRKLLSFTKQLAGSERILVHCSAGISRSTACAAVLLAQLQPDRDYDEIFQSVVELRKNAWPNLKIIQLADRELRAEGAFVEALERFYLTQYTRNPGCATSLYRSTRRAKLAADADSFRR